jgi:hypothetical protein
MAPVNAKFESERIVCHLGCVAAREVGHGTRVSCIDNNTLGFYSTDKEDFVDDIAERSACCKELSLE